MKPIRLTGGLVTLLLFAAAYTPLPNVLFGTTAIAADVGPADAIIVLGGAAEPRLLKANSLRRAVLGVQLQRRGVAPLLVFSGQPYEVEARTAIALDCGVSRGSVIRIAPTNTTRDEAALAAAHLRPLGARRVVLVTDSLHLARAKPVFERAGFTVLPAPADALSEHTGRPNERLLMMAWILQEWAALVYYEVSERLGVSP